MKILFGIMALLAGGLLSGIAAESAGKDSRLQHVVSFRFKDTATKEQIKKVEDAFRALKTKIKEIKDFQWGTNVSPEKHDKGFTHCWILTFGSDKDRDTYLHHPDHKEFGKIVGPYLADVFVVDFWVKE